MAQVREKTIAEKNERITFQKNDVATAWTFITGRGGEVVKHSQVKLGF